MSERVTSAGDRGSSDPGGDDELRVARAASRRIVALAEGGALAIAGSTRSTATCGLGRQAFGDTPRFGGIDVDRRRGAMWAVCGPLAIIITLQLAAIGVAPRVLAGAEPEAYALPYRAPWARPNDVLEQRILTLLNSARQGAGLPPLASDGGLARIARAYAIELFAGGYLSHTSPRGQAPRDRFLAAGIDAGILGENLAYASSVREAHEALMASTQHRENILFAGYRVVGIGVADGGTRGVVVVEDFADALARPALTATPP